MGQTWPMDDGWDPIRVRVGGDDEHPAGPRKKVRHLSVASEPIIGPGPEADDEVDVTLPRLEFPVLRVPEAALASNTPSAPAIRLRPAERTPHTENPVERASGRCRTF